MGLNLATPIPSTYCHLEVKSGRVDLLHLMCRIHAQSDSLQLNNMLAQSNYWATWGVSGVVIAQ